jgi:predicted small lipoprotein YifL
MRRTLRGLVPLAAVLTLGACAELAPLREPPLDPANDLTMVNTREEAIQRFGPPHEIRSSDLGPVLVYRRAVVIDVNPNRYHGEDRGDRLDRYELVLLYVDTEGRIVRRAIEPE